MQHDPVNISQDFKGRSLEYSLTDALAEGLWIAPVDAVWARFSTLELGDDEG